MDGKWGCYKTMHFGQNYRFSLVEGLGGSVVSWFALRRDAIDQGFRGDQMVVQCNSYLDRAA